MDQPITLQQLLASRDARRGKQLQYLDANKGSTLIVLTVVIPGNVKRCADSLAIARAGIDAVNTVFADDVTTIATEDLPTGFEAYFISSLPPDKCKELTSAIEDSHPLGRLMDLDVFTPQGKAVSRVDRAKEPRRCLLCGNDARICMRAFTHTQQELLAEIHRRVKLWQQNPVYSPSAASGTENPESSANQNSR